MSPTSTTSSSSTDSGTSPAAAPAPVDALRYDAASANAIERKWQDHWSSSGAFVTPNPDEAGFSAHADKAKQYILDMFPYPSGVGLHVGHPLGYIATDIYARFLRATGHHVLHAMGYDAFGLPAEQFAVEHGVHPAITTQRNIDNMRVQLARLGLAHDPTRSVATTDPAFYRWTQWIFLQVYNAWFDENEKRARPIDELVAEFADGSRSTRHSEINPDARPWDDLSEDEQRLMIDAHRLAYLAEVPVNWCPALGTVLANEEVTAEGRSERGNHPVYKRPMKQWMMRITKFADRLLDDLEPLAWPESTKMMQRNWIGKSHGAYVDFATDIEPIRVFTTRPDTLFGATYMVLAPEHPLVDALTTTHWPDSTPDAWRGHDDAAASPVEAIAEYRRIAETRSDIQRQSDSREKTGVFTGACAINPANNERIPIFVADYVLMGYGTGAIMAVPGQDQRDWDFAKAFGLPIVRTVEPPDEFGDEPFTGDGPAINSDFLNGLSMSRAKQRMIAWLEANGCGEGTVQYKLRDWLFSRQRYWGEPFPILHDEKGRVIALEDSELPVLLPELDDFSPSASDDPDAPPQPPLGRAKQWTTVERDGVMMQRELNTMPQWAGSCWYYLRYLDPTNENAFVDPDVERYWMLSRKENVKSETDSSGNTFDPSIHHIGGVDLYVGGVEHAVLHLLYARFWHKVLFDLGHVSTPEPFGRLFNQGYIQAFAYTDERGVYIPAQEVEERGDEYFHGGKPVHRSYGKMGKSLKNAVSPDEMFEQYGCDTLRLYEMSMGPLEQSKPWNTRDIVGSQRFLQRVWRNFVDPETGASRIRNMTPDESINRLLHKTIAKVRDEMSSLRFNTAIAHLIEFNNELVSLERLSRTIAEPFVKMLAPFVPHLAYELWQRLGHTSALMYEPYPEADSALIVDDEIEIPVQIMGKLRATVHVPNGADEETVKNAALAHERIAELLEGCTIRKVIYVPNRLINFVAPPGKK